MEARNRYALRTGSEEPEFEQQEEAAAPIAGRVVPLRRRSATTRRRAAETPEARQLHAVDTAVGPARPAPAPSSETTARPTPTAADDRAVVIPPGLAERLRERQAELQARLAWLDAESQD